MWTLRHWVMGTYEFKCKKIRVEQKSAEQKLCDPAEQKLAEQKLVGTFGLWVMGTPKSKFKKDRAEQKSVEQNLCDPVEQKLAEQNLVWTFGQNKNQSRTKIRWGPLDFG